MVGAGGSNAEPSLKSRTYVAGLLFLATVLVAELTTLVPFRTPNPGVLLFPLLVYVAWRGPLRLAWAVFGLSAAYLATHLLLYGEQTLGFVGLDLYRFGTFAAAGAGTVLLVNSLRIQTQRATRIEAERDLMAAVVEAAPAAVMVLRWPQAQVLLSNASARALFDAPNGSGLPDTAPAFHASARPAIEEAMAQRRPVALPETAHEVAGRPRHLAGVAVPLEPTERQPRVLVMLLDVTEQREAEAGMAAARRELAASDRMATLGTLVSGLSHEMRTPLTYAYARLALLARQVEQAVPDAAARAALEEHMREMDLGLDRLNRLVDDLRRYAKGRGQGRTSVELSPAVEEAITLWQAAHPHDLQLALELHARGRISADRNQVQQAVLNLLTNAAEALGGSGSIRVATRDEDGHVVVEVEDDGPGVPPDVQAHMWEPFFTTKAYGTGLGLSVVRRVAEAHGATIACQSEPGSGTTFQLRFPRLEEPPSRALDAVTA